MGGLFGGGSTTYIEGNRVGEFKLNDSSYGKYVPVILGTTRISCNVIDWADFKEHAHATEQNSGKGGAGVTTVTTTYTYTVKALLALCEGPISSVKRIWCGTKIYNSPAEAGLTLFNGTLGQMPWDGLKYYGDGVNIGPHYLSYSNLAYCAGEIDLGNGGTLPTFNFEIVSAGVPLADGYDVNPADAINYIIFNEINGAGFGGGTIDAASLENYRNYCRAADLYISIPEDVQGDPAKDLINSILEATNSIGFWSQDKLKIVVLADESITGNGITWTPNLTPVFDLNADDFIPIDKNSGALVEFTREDNSESYNEITVEFLNRANSYEKETVSFQVLSDISRRGLRPASTKNIHFFHTKKRAQTAAEYLAMKSLYARNQYKFRLAWSHCLLEPGDLVTLTDPHLGLDHTLVRINEVDEAADGELEFSAFAASVGIASSVRYEVIDAERPTLDTNIEPGNAKTPLIFSVASAIEPRAIAIATCGVNPDTWGGAVIWVSFDDVAYWRIGEVKGPARYGALVGSIGPADTTITVRLEDGNAHLLSVTEQAAEANSTPCWLDGEWINYRDAELIDEQTYRLSGVTRGFYMKEGTSHSSGATFARYDSAITQYLYREEDIGKTLYVKLQSFNVFLTNLQDISTVPVYTHVIERGDAPPAVPTNLTATGWFGYIALEWVNPTDPDLSHVEIWENSVDDRDTAVKIAEVTGSSYQRHLGSFVVRYYWAKAVDTTGNVSGFNALAGTAGNSDQENHQDFVDLVLQENPYLTEVQTDLNTAITLVDTNIKTIDLPAYEQRIADRIDEVNDGIMTQVNTYADGTIDAMLDASEAISVVRDAGIITDPATGLTSIFALDAYKTANDTRVSTVEINLDAVESTLTSKVTLAQVDERIAGAVFGDAGELLLSGVDARISVVEESLDAVEGTLIEKASVVDVNALGGRIGTAESRLDGQDAEIALLATSQELDAVELRVTTAEVNIDALEGSIVSSVTSSANVTQDEEELIAQGLVDAMLNTQESTAETREKSRTALSLAETELYAHISDEMEAEAGQRLLLAVKVDNNQAAIQSEATARATADEAIASKVETLTTTVGSNTSAIQTEQTARANADSSLASQITTLQGTVGGNTSAIQSEATARTNADGALASDVETLQTTVGDNTASIQTLANSVDGIEGKYAVKIDVNGYVTGYELIGTGASSAMMFLVDNFIVGKPGQTNRYPFVIGTVDGVTRVSIDSAFIQDASIKNAKIADLTVGRIKIASGYDYGLSWGQSAGSNASVTYTAAGYYYPTGGSLAVVSEARGRVLIQAFIKLRYWNSAFDVVLLKDGVVVDNMGGANGGAWDPIYTFFSFYVDNAPKTGATTYQLRVYHNGGEATYLSGVGISALIIHR